MCLICIELDKGALTPWEAAKNRVEYLDELDEEHLEVLDTKIRNALFVYLNGFSDDDPECSQ